jgi:hypothetical protein
MRRPAACLLSVSAAATVIQLTPTMAISARAAALDVLWRETSMPPPFAILPHGPFASKVALSG